LKLSWEVFERGDLETVEGGFVKKGYEGALPLAVDSLPKPMKVEGK